VNTGWPLMLTFVGVMFAWGVAQFWSKNSN
jgi:hypothetical protein